LDGLDVPTRGVRCNACAEIIFTYKEASRHDRFLTDAFVKRGIARGREFMWVRKELGLKANEVAAMLDVTP
jgi:hypothetical protein